jgi:hypothetical protein
LPKYNGSHISEQTINEVIISMTGILREIENLDEKKSFGFCEVPANIIKLCKTIDGIEKRNATNIQKAKVD